MSTCKIAPVSGAMDEQIAHGINTKTKPLGSLGLLEKYAAKLAAIQQTLTPSVSKAQMLVFAGDHGVCAQGFSAFPAEVTPQMVHNFLHGGAAVSVFCQQHHVPLLVVDVGVNVEFTAHPLLCRAKVARGTYDFTVRPALELEQVEQALTVGRQRVRHSIEQYGTELFLFGEMGIGNTGVSSCLMSAILGISPEQTVGRGTGLDDDGVARKAMLIQRAFDRVKKEHGGSPGAWPLELVLQEFGGLEILAIAGAMLESAAHGRAFLVDGFICTVALLIAEQVNQHVLDYALFAHQSNEQAHQTLLEHFNAEPVLDLGLRLGEGSGAILAYPLLQSACVFLGQMASFESAGVADGSS
ncbi:nicotinate-nucleotide--dimethylbenzimidazole phosphoribosyltransferase [Maribrevibacterium harenarium]|uniref:Nicotinate-nucleotide--dimethylbenzimidazole phosphoribosyltransferase n=1 Tax=Maribrevibacterium harenarium TaxID=2589817 RepID=A0A501X1Y7_9GAMM|nr:nicotinate-nucleotide--dimethylbenzimidazole phosphoribosyltransferase [Maribrevibacterium harenarium]TPE54488.1 nicotinate-nucleotide--dimethylbenzimidazole phosphoribosyltransferase [Maribrevibacterium harenarium]